MRQRPFPDYNPEIRPADNAIGIADDLITAMAIFGDQRHPVRFAPSKAGMRSSISLAGVTGTCVVLS
jgi:hypothetical protein